MVRKPALTDDPIFPLRRKFWIANFTVEGLERKEDCTGATYDKALEPKPTEDDLKGKSEIIRYGEDAPKDDKIKYKISADGRWLPVDDDNVWIRRSNKWKPQEVPQDVWKDYTYMHDQFR